MLWDEGWQVGRFIGRSVEEESKMFGLHSCRGIFGVGREKEGE